MASLSEWQQAVDALVRESFDLPLHAFGFCNYGEPAVAAQHGLPTHPDGSPRMAWQNGILPTQYATRLVTVLINCGYCS